LEEQDETPLGRAFRIVEILAVAPEAMTLTEIAAAVGLGVTTAHRQLASLTALGLVQKASGKTFVIGQRMHRLAGRLSQGRDVAVLAEPILCELAERFGETAFLARLDGSHVQLVATALPDASGQAYAQPGRDMPLYAAASGKILLALQDEPFIARYMKLTRHAYTPATRTDEAAIRSDIATARARHIAICDNEFDPGILSYATAIRDPQTGEPYAVAVFGLKERFGQVKPAAIETALINAGQKLSRVLRGA
jgi:IclR family acetate operon transcriptional repressor